MKRKLTVLVAISAALTLAGCSQTSQGNSQPQQSKTSKVSKNNSNTSSSSESGSKNNNQNSNNNGSTKLSAENMDYKTTASAITVYAAQKYGDSWEIAMNAAKSNNLGVAFRTKSATGISSDNNGYVYEVSGTGKSSNARYMLKGDGAGKEVTIFIKQRNLGTTTLSEIVKYINDNNDVKTVQDLAKNAQLDVKLEGNEDSNQASSSESVIPSELQGTWYTADTGNGNIDTLTVSGDKINDEAGCSMNVKKENTDKADSDSLSGYMKQTTINGIKFYSFTNMGQEPGQGSTYLARHTENGQEVIVSANSKGTTNAVYWKSKDLAKQNTNKQFSDLKY